MKVREFPILYKRTSSGAPQIWKIWVEAAESGNGVLCTEFGREPGKKQLAREEIKSGKNTGRRNATTAVSQAEAEAAARWEKQKTRKGYGLTVAESAAVRGSSPMLAQVYEKQRKRVQWDTAVTQPKLDGFRCLIQKDAGGKIFALSRENKPLQVPHLLDALAAFVEPGQILDGELYYHGMSLPQIASLCKKLQPDTAKLQYHIYDLLHQGPYKERYAILEDKVKLARRHAGDKLKLIESIKVRNEDELMRCQAKFIEDGYEGAMLRYGKGGYEAGKRSAALLKVKTFLSEEFTVVDVKFGRGRYEGAAIFTCQTPVGHHFDVLAPGTVEEKKAYGANSAVYVGKSLTVSFIYMTKTEEPVPFLPVAVGFRED